MDIRVEFRRFEPSDLPGLSWTGDAEHLRAVAGGYGSALAGDLVQLVGALPNQSLVAYGAADLARSADSATITMLSVHELLQSVGVGTALIAELERRVTASGRSRVRIAVEHDNPRAAALYRRLGYTECGSEVQSWLIGPGRGYVTVCTVLERRPGGRTAAG